MPGCFPKVPCGFQLSKPWLLRSAGAGVTLPFLRTAPAVQKVIWMEKNWDMIKVSEGIIQCVLALPQQEICPLSCHAAAIMGSPSKVLKPWHQAER